MDAASERYSQCLDSGNVKKILSWLKAKHRENLI